MILQTVRRRSAVPSPSGHERVVLTLDLATPLAPSEAGRILFEALEKREQPLPGQLDLYEAQVTRQRIRLEVGPLFPSSLRLDGVLHVIDRRDFQAVCSAALAIVSEAASLLSQLSVAPSSALCRPFHGRVCASGLLLEKDGALRSIGGGFERLTEVLAPGTDADLSSLAPEVLLGSTASERSDVFGLGALAYFALAGIPYRHMLDATALREAAREGRQADLPAALRGPAAALAPVLARALAPSPEDRWSSIDVFKTALKRSLEALHPGLLSGREVLIALHGAAQSSAARGAGVLGAQEPPPGEAAPRRRAPRQHQTGEIVISAVPSLEPPALESIGDWSEERTLPSEAPLFEHAETGIEISFVEEDDELLILPPVELPSSPRVREAAPLARVSVLPPRALPVRDPAETAPARDLEQQLPAALDRIAAFAEDLGITSDISLATQEVPVVAAPGGRPRIWLWLAVLVLLFAVAGRWLSG